MFVERFGRRGAPGRASGVSSRNPDASDPALPDEPVDDDLTAAPANEPEREVQHTPQVLEGEDDLPRQPTSQRDPFVPEPGPRPGEQRAWQLMRLALIPVVVVVAIVLYAALR